MIRVIEEKKVPKAQVKCSNCGSLLEYGNADLHVDYDAERTDTFSAYRMSTLSRPLCFSCPVCGCNNSARCSTQFVIPSSFYTF